MARGGPFVATVPVLPSSPALTSVGDIFAKINPSGLARRVEKFDAERGDGLSEFDEEAPDGNEAPPLELRPPVTLTMLGRGGARAHPPSPVRSPGQLTNEERNLR